jgi:3-deoxy-D-manno-octulosonate 8-phosphate phosphatase (KDO 8-P phosphatase)
MIKTVIFDVDGVFTDGSFIYTVDGKVAKRFGPHDADGVKMLREAGFQVSCISADHRGFQITKARCDDMDLDLSLVSEATRLTWFQKLGYLNEVCFMGDGRFDAAVFPYVAYSIAPANALEVARSSASFVTSARGGDGAVYEAALHLLSMQSET